METQYIGYQDKSGKPAYREATFEELADIQTTQPIVWHYPELPIRVEISNELKAQWLLKKSEHDILGDYPEIAGLLDYVKSMSSTTIVSNGALHVYLSEIYPQHKAIIENNGAIVEYKP